MGVYLYVLLISFGYNYSMDLARKIMNYKIAVIGLGYVGLPPTLFQKNMR